MTTLNSCCARKLRILRFIGIATMAAAISTASAQAPVPLGKPAVERPLPTSVTVTNVRPQFGFSITEFVVGPVPQSLEGCTLITRRPGQVGPDVAAGRIEVSVKVDGPVIIAATWKSDGGIEPAWKDQIWTERKFLDEGWQPLDKVTMSYPGSGSSAPYQLFVRNGKAGEKFLIRTRKYNPPLVIVPSAAFKIPAAVATASTSAPAPASAPASPPAAEAPLPEVPMPTRVRVTNVKPQAAYSVEPLCRGNVPPELRGATIIQRQLTVKGSADLEAGRSRLDVLADGPVYVAATWELDGRIEDAWRNQIWDERRFVAEGWRLIDIIELGPANSLVPLQYLLYRRDCKAGESFLLRTRKYGAPLVIVPPATETPSKFADWDPSPGWSEERQRDAVARKFRALMLEKRFAELDAWISRLWKTGAKFPSGHYVSASTRRKITLVPHLYEPTEEEGVFYIGLAEEWLKQMPKSNPARITVAALRVAHTESQEWNGGTQAAEIDETRRRCLELLYEIEKSDPTIGDAYGAILQLGRWADWDLTLIDDYVDRVLTHCDWCPAALTQAFLRYRQLEEGETKEDRNRRLQGLFDRIADRTRAKYGDALFAAIVSNVEFKPVDLPQRHFGFSWPRLKASFDDWVKLFPNSLRIKQQYCLWAQLYGDRATAAPLFALFTDEEADVETVWKDRYRLMMRRIWAQPDYTTGQQIEMLEYPTNLIYGAHVRPDGRVVVCDPQGAVTILERKTNALERAVEVEAVATFRHPAAYAFRSDGNRYVFGGNYGEVAKVNVSTSGKSEWFREQFDGSTHVSAVALTPDEKQFVVAYGPERLLIYDLDDEAWKGYFPDPKRELAGSRRGEVRGLGFIDGGKTLVVLTADSYVELRNFADGKSIKVWQAQPQPGAPGMGLSRDGKLLATVGTGGIIRLWSLPDAQMIAELPKLPNPVSAFAFSPDGRYLAAGEAPRKPRPSAVHLYDLQARTFVRAFQGHKADVSALQFLPDGKTLMSASEDMSVRFWALP